MPEQIVQNSIHIYPIPVQKQLFIDYGGTEKLDIQLYNSFGQLVLQQSKDPNHELIHEMELPNLPNGTYFLTFLGGKNNFVQKIVLMH